MRKGNELKPRIGLFGRRNVGKSTMVNYLTGQQTAIVSDTAGTTTDPVRKSMEIGGIGPVVLIDTAGIDDEGALGMQRVEKSMGALAEVDLALLLYTEWGEPEERVDRWCREHGTAVLHIRTKADVGTRRAASAAESEASTADAARRVPTDLAFSAHDSTLHPALVELIRRALPESAYRGRSLLGDIVRAGDHVVLVTPIDSSAPEGRMILPQVQVLRDLMDLHAVATFCQPEELTNFEFRKLNFENTEDTQKSKFKIQNSKLVITDSQVFQRVAEAVPREVPLTSFSIVLARQKGLFREYLAGTRTIGQLQDGDRVLLLESCTHNVTCEDIGRVKLPAAMRKKTGKEIECEVIGGQSPLPSDLSQYALVIQCGGCVITAQQVKARLLPALEAGVPVSNYGLALAWCTGIFDRATKIFRK